VYHWETVHGVLVLICLLTLYHGKQAHHFTITVLYSNFFQLNEKDASDAPDEDRLRWIQEEEKRISSMRESSQRLQEQLLQQQTMLEKREAFLKEKLCLEKRKTKVIICP
jgi:hypothetical protein